MFLLPHSTPPLTPDGIQALLRLTGNFQKTNVVVQILPRGCAMTYVEEHNVVISDGCQLLPAVIDVRRTQEQMEEVILGVYRIKVALLCPFPSEEYGFCNTLVIASLEKCTEAVPGIIGRPWQEASLDRDETSPQEKNIPIAAVPFIFPRYSGVPCIRALVTFKSRLYYSNDTEKTPSYFVIHLMDESSEILTEAFGRVLVEEVYHRLQIGKIYYFYWLNYSGSYIRGSYYFNLRNRNQFSLMKSTVIEECHTPSIKSLQYRFRFITIPRLQAVKLNLEIYFHDNPSKRKRFHCSIDAIGIVKKVSSISEESPFYLRSNVKVPVRDVTIYDQSGTELLVRLWSHNAEEFIARPGDIVAFRNAHLFDHPLQLVENESGPSLTQDGQPTVPHRILSVMSRSTVHLEPDVEERFALRLWYNSTQESLTAGTGSELCEKELDA